MADHTKQDQPTGATLHAAISHAVVGLLREYTGRGPTKSRTTIRDNVVLVMLEQTLTKGEESLVNKGRADKVIEIRHEFQEAMREATMAKVADLTGRHVIAMLSANHVNPDIGAEIYVLDGPPDHHRLTPPNRQTAPPNPDTTHTQPPPQPHHTNTKTPHNRHQPKTTAHRHPARPAPQHATPAPTPNLSRT